MPRPRIEDAEDRLLAAGLNLFARRGTERVNTNAIAKRAQLAVGTFYNHFPDKHALLREIQNRTVGALRAARVEATRGAGTDPEAQVRASAGAAVAFAESHAQAYRVTFGRERAGATAHGPVVSESTRPTADGLRRLQAAGRVDPALDPDLAARAYLAMEVGTILWWLDDPSRAGRDGVVDTLVRLHPALGARLR
ncbi:MAG: TetR/AcrR family transcriptional regulator [bacterium]|nr:TetR/AcrR family transcriptional regulator [bacterium]